MAKMKKDPNYFTATSSKTGQKFTIKEGEQGMISNMKAGEGFSTPNAIGATKGLSDMAQAISGKKYKPKVGK